MDKEYLDDIQTYYEQCNRDYEVVLQLKESKALHYGYWDEDTLSNRQALWNKNYQVAKMAQIKADDYVLDAGCGVGGTSFFLANNIGCKVEGVSISPFQVKSANEAKGEWDKNGLTNFTCQDYCYTNFPDNTFDVVFGLESICHAEPKSAFLKEAFRVLKPGGRLLVVAFTAKEDMTEDEKIHIGKFAKSWELKEFIQERSFSKDLKDIGFKNRFIKDFTPNSFPTVKLLHRAYYPGIVIAKVGKIFGQYTDVQIENAMSIKYQYTTYMDGLWTSKFFFATKGDENIKIEDYDTYTAPDPDCEIFIDNESFKSRFPVFSKKGFSMKNVFKQYGYRYMERNIKDPNKKF